MVIKRSVDEADFGTFVVVVKKYLVSRNTSEELPVPLSDCVIVPYINISCDSH